MNSTTSLLTLDETQEKIRMSNEVPVNLDTPTDESDLNSPLFRPQPTSVEKIMLVINRLKNSNAFGSDEIPTRFIKDSVFVTAYYITVIVNTSIVTGFFPSLWKYSLVNPKLKKGDVDNPSNFRPLSILPVLSKVLERIVADQLMTYLESKDLISKTQHGFRKQLSTETALLQITNAVYKNIDDKKISLLMLCDLSKAFDSVSHEVLMRKFSDLQIDPFWFEDYLKNRIQSVRIENTISDTAKVEYGVPQGSILGPILFLIYINDMSKYITDCLLVQYADDTQILISENIYNINLLIRKAENLLSKVKKYFLTNGLLVNANKTQCILISSAQYLNKIPEVKICCDGEYIIPSQTVKNLGLYIDRTMTFNTHIEEMCKKVTGILMYVNRIGNTFDWKTRTQIVESITLRIINYCRIIWGSIADLYLDKARKIQNFAARVAVGESGNTTT